MGEKPRSRHFTSLVDFVGKLAGAQLSHCQKLEHAILHVLEAVVIFLENRFGALQIELIVRSLVPRQFGDPLEIGADHLRFHRLTTSSLESSELALYFGARLFRQLQLRELVAKLGDLFARVVVAQLFLDRFELLA